jgi:2-hydroxychromene-2-carboxylate isomerase
MVKQLSFWFEFASTYSYLTAMRIEEAAADREVEVVWRPFSLGPIFVAQGWTSSPFNIYPAKGAYMWRDVARRAASLNLPMKQPNPFPQNTLLAGRVAIQALKQGEAGVRFCKNVYRAEFADGRDLSDPTVLGALLEEEGLPPNLLETAVEPEGKQALKDAVAEAQALGIFGAPSFIVGDELFWGDDRLENALAWACGDISEPAKSDRE